MIFKRKNAAPSADKPLWVRVATYAGSVLLVFMLVLSMYWSRTPDVFWVSEKVDGERTVIGYATTDTLIRVAETMLDKPGGYLSNDVMPPSVFLDNIPNWEVGVLQQVRDLARVMRNDYSRSQSQSSEDADLADAEPRFFIEHTKWMFPRAENEYRTAINGFASYRDRLSGIGDSEAQFFARADNLREWLSQVEKRLGSVTRRLGNSVATSVVNTFRPPHQPVVTRFQSRRDQMRHLLLKRRGDCAQLKCGGESNGVAPDCVEYSYVKQSSASGETGRKSRWCW